MTEISLIVTLNSQFNSTHSTQTSEIEQTLDTGCQTDKAYFVSAESLNDDEKSSLENIICFPAGKYKLKQRWNNVELQRCKDIRFG